MSSYDKLKKKNIVDPTTKAIFLLLWREKWAQIDIVLDGKKESRTDGDISTIAPGSRKEWIEEYFLFVASGAFRSKGIEDPEKYAKDLYDRSTSSGVIFVDDVLQGISQIINYGPVEGMDITYKGRNFSLKGDDFLSAKGFKIWLLSEFGENLAIPITANDPEWTGLVVIFQRLAESKPVANYDLASPVFSDLVLSLRRSKIYTEWDEEALKNLDRAGVKHYFLVDGVFYLHTKIYSEMIEAHELTRRKMRQYFEPYLASQGSKVVHIGGMLFRFWTLDWNSMVRDIPELGQIMSEQHISPDFDVRCKACGAVFLFASGGDEDKFLDDHTVLHSLAEPDSGEKYKEFLNANFDFKTADEIAKVKMK